MKVKEPTGRVLFEERQSFPKWLGILLLSPVLIFVGLIVAMSTVEGTDKNEMMIAIAIIIPVELFCFYLFYFVRLHKIVTSDGLYYRWLPLQKNYRVIRKEDISSMELLKGPSMKYGPSWLPRYGKLYSVSDGMGVQLYFNNGKKAFFGTAESFLFERAIRDMVSK